MPATQAQPAWRGRLLHQSEGRVTRIPDFDFESGQIGGSQSSSLRAFGFFAGFGGNPHPLWDTTKDEDPLGNLLVILHPYILHGAYWYESVYSRGNGGTVFPTVRSHILSATGASPEPRRCLAVVPCFLSRVLRRGNGEAPVRPARRSGAWLEEPGAGGSTI